MAQVGYFRRGLFSLKLFPTSVCSILKNPTIPSSGVLGHFSGLTRTRAIVPQVGGIVQTRAKG